MFAKATIILSLLSVAAQVAVATPPACLIAAMSKMDNPADVSGICKNDASSVESYLSSKCGDNKQAALDAFKSTCKNAGVTVSVSSYASSSGSMKTSTKTGSHTGSPSSYATGTGYSYPSSVSASATGTGAGSSATGAAGMGAGYGSGSGAGGYGNSTMPGSAGNSSSPTSSPPANINSANTIINFDFTLVVAAAVVGVAVAL